MLVHRFRSSTVWLVALCAFFAAPSCNRAAERLPGQMFNRMVYIRTSDGAETFVNVPDHYDVGSPSISPDGKHVAFDAMTVGREPVRESWVVDSDGSGLHKVTDAATPRWSPDGKLLLLSRATILGLSTVRYDILQYDLAAKKETVVCEGRFPDWSPDGKRIIFAKDGEHTENSGVHPGSKLWIATADGSKPEELCEGNWPSWSPDGKTIAYCMQDKTPSEIWTIDLATKKSEKIALGFYRAQWDGKSKCFVCNGSIQIPNETTYTHGPALFMRDTPLAPHFFSTQLDNPWSPCLSRDGKLLTMIVDSQKRRGQEEEK